MRLRTGALAVNLLVLLPSGSDTASLPHGALTRLVNLGDINPNWLSQETTNRAATAPLFHQQPEAEEYAARPSSSLVPVPAPAPAIQAQGRLATQGPRQVEGWLQEHLKTNAARNERPAQPSMGQAHRTAAQVYDLHGKRKFADIEVVADEFAHKLFGRSPPTKNRGVYFQMGTPKQQAWVLKRLQEQQNQLSDHSSEILVPSQSGEMPVLQMDHKVLIQGINKGNRFVPHRDIPFTRPYIVGDHLIYFQRKKDSGLVYVFAIPVSQGPRSFVSRKYRVNFLGALEFQPNVSSRAPSSRVGRDEAGAELRSGDQDIDQA